MTVTIGPCPGCCDPCALGPSLDLVLAGVIMCGCTFIDSSHSISWTNLSGLNTAHNLPVTPPSTAQWDLSAGSVDWALYDDPTCSGAILDGGSTTFNLQITCGRDTPGVLRIDVDTAAFVAAGPFSVSSQSVFLALDSPLDEVTPNDHVAAGCPMQGGYDGTGTISRP